MLIIIFSIALVVVLVILVVTTVLFFKDRNYVPPEIPVARNSTPLEECTIAELAERIGTEELDDKSLLKVVDLVARSHKFPKKDNNKAPKEVEAHLKFVYEFCMNKSASAKIIVKMSNTLKAVNEQYKRDIENIEKTAIKDLDAKQTIELA